jgi:hypothetical protein
LKDQSLTLLGRLRTRPEIVSEFPKIVAQVWERTQGDADKNARKLTARAEEQKKFKAELLRAKLRKEVPQADYEQANAEFSREIASLDRQLQEIGAAAPAPMPLFGSSNSPWWTSPRSGNAPTMTNVAEFDKSYFPWLCCSTPNANCRPPATARCSTS